MVGSRNIFAFTSSFLGCRLHNLVFEQSYYFLQWFTGSKRVLYQKEERNFSSPSHPQMSKLLSITNYRCIKTKFACWKNWTMTCLIFWYVDQKGQHNDTFAVSFAKEEVLQNFYSTSEVKISNSMLLLLFCFSIFLLALNTRLYKRHYIQASTNHHS